MLVFPRGGEAENGISKCVEGIPLCLLPVGSTLGRLAPQDLWHGTVGIVGGSSRGFVTLVLQWIKDHFCIFSVLRRSRPHLPLTHHFLLLFKLSVGHGAQSLATRLRPALGGGRGRPTAAGAGGDAEGGIGDEGPVQAQRSGCHFS